jgi:hypothetical protein
MIAEREKQYSKLWGRDPDFIRHPTDQSIPHIDVYRFPKTGDKSNPVSFRNVYMTGGMSEREMNIPDHLREDVFPRIEITAYSEKIIMMEKVEMDFICTILHWFAQYPFEEATFFAPWQTFQIGEPIIPDSEMTAYLFCQTPIVNADDLFDHVPNADNFIHLVPISEAERQYAVSEGTQKLLEVFHNHGINPDFDLDRKSTL